MTSLRLPKQVQGGSLETKLSLSPCMLNHILHLHNACGSVGSLIRQLAILVRSEAEAQMQVWAGSKTRSHRLYLAQAHKHH